MQLASLLPILCDIHQCQPDNYGDTGLLKTVSVGSRGSHPYRTIIIEGKRVTP